MQFGMFSTRSSSVINRESNKRLVKLIHSLLNMEESVNFRKPVAHKGKSGALGLEDYRNVVKRPIDLNFIRRQNNEGRYKSVEEALDDIQLCWDNCRMYNNPESLIAQEAAFMEAAFHRLGDSLFPDLWRQVDLAAHHSAIDAEVQHHRKSSKLIVKKKVISQPQIQPQSIAEIVPNSEPNAMDSKVQIAAEPIIIRLDERPTAAQLHALNDDIRHIYENRGNGVMEKILEVLYTHEKEHMNMQKNGRTTFNMSAIHISTYERIRKLVGLPYDTYDIIE